MESMDCGFVLFVICLFVILVIYHFGFENRILVLFVSVPGHCLSFTFYPLFCLTRTLLFKRLLVHIASKLILIFQLFLENFVELFHCFLETEICFSHACLSKKLQRKNVNKE